jgi:zona occludens toxin
VFVLVTGAPGTGKSLWTIHNLKNVDDRPVFYYGIPEVTLDWHLLKEPLTWPDEVPDGSIVVIDEVQKIFPALGKGSEKPPGVAALETHRHRGLDVYFITQHPSLLHHAARRLVNRHIHLNRPKGLKFSNLYDSDVLMETPQRLYTLKGIEKQVFKYPKDTFQLYKSSVEHTHKTRLSWRIWAVVVGLPIIFAALVYSVLWAVDRLGSDDDIQLNHELQNTNPTTPHYNSEQSLTISRHQVDAFLDSLEVAYTDLPWLSAAAIQNLEVHDPPFVSGCSSVEYQGIRTCKCYSQQGVRLDVSPSFCFRFMRDGGWHNPFKKPPRSRDQQTAILETKTPRL